MICLCLLLTACATFKQPVTIDEVSVKQRALTKESGGVRASVSLVGDEEARRIFGIDLREMSIQALWLAIENGSDRSMLLLPTAIDSEYFAPLEVAFAYHKLFAAAANKALDEHLMKLNFPIRSLILPGTRAAGYIFISRSEQVKSIDIDLLGDGFSRNFTFFVPNPNSSERSEIVSKIETMFATSDLKTVESEEALRRTLENFPCCVSFDKEGSSAEPLNLVIIGALDDWTTAFIRRGYHYHFLNPRHLFGRSQDISGKKSRRGYTRPQAHTVRLWQTPIRYQGKPVWLGQTGTRRGGRFSDDERTEATLPLDPYVDESRNDLTQDLAYSQGLVKIGYVKGAGRPPSTGREDRDDDIQYTTDGLRAVLMFGDRPASLTTIDFFDWERLADYAVEKARQ